MWVYFKKLEYLNDYDLVECVGLVFLVDSQGTAVGLDRLLTINSSEVLCTKF